ncbi:MAG: histidine kinase [Burkholderiales bacterium]|nr:histidine kinase [Burkholderiales bacterium]
MHPILSDFRKFLWYVAVWLLAGVFIAKLLVTAGLSPWSYALLFALPPALVYGFLASSAYYLCRAFPYSRRSFLLAIAVFGGAALISAFVWLALCHGWNRALTSLTEDAAALVIAPHLSAALLAGGFGVYLLSLLAYDVLIAFDNVRAAERQAAESRLLARDAELQVLRSQIDPHFLFNSLNSISALTAIDPAGARTMTIALADFFRQTLALSKQEKITVAEEWRLCENFLAVEKIRFGKKLQLELSLSPDAEPALIPPLILQPLLENAIKHGIRNIATGGVIAVTILKRGQWLHIAVQNPVVPLALASPGNGLGLHNLRLRFVALYGDQARVSWSKTPQHFLVEMSLPFERESHE